MLRIISLDKNNTRYAVPSWLGKKVCVMLIMNNLVTQHTTKCLKYMVQLKIESFFSNLSCLFASLKLHPFAYAKCSSQTEKIAVPTINFLPPFLYPALHRIYKKNPLTGSTFAITLCIIQNQILLWHTTQLSNDGFCIKILQNLTKCTALNGWKIPQNATFYKTNTSQRVVK